MRLLVRFSKVEAARYISHLDLIRLMQRVLRRAGVPVSYTEGYHPHPKMAFASALGVGIESRGEYMDLALDEDVDPARCMEDINRVMPAHIRVMGIKPLDTGTKGLMGMVAAASYVISIPVDKKELAQRCDTIIKADTWHTTVIRKNREQDVDIRAGLRRLRVHNGGIDLLVDAGSRRNLHPVWFADALWPRDEREAGQAARIMRTDLYRESGGLISMWEMEA